MGDLFRRGTPGGIRTPNLLIRSYLLELKLMRFPQLNRVSKCQEESGNVTNVGDVTDISTDIAEILFSRDFGLCQDDFYEGGRFEGTFAR